MVAKLLSLIVEFLKSQNSSSSRTWLSLYANKCFKLCPRANNESATVAVCGASVSYKMCQPFALCGCPNNFRPLTPALPPAAAPNSHYTSNHGTSVSVSSFYFWIRKLLFHINSLFWCRCNVWNGFRIKDLLVWVLKWYYINLTLICHKSVGFKTVREYYSKVTKL